MLGRPGSTHLRVPSGATVNHMRSALRIAIVACSTTPCAALRAQDFAFYDWGATSARFVTAWNTRAVIAPDGNGPEAFAEHHAPQMETQLAPGTPRSEAANALTHHGAGHEGMDHSGGNSDSAKEGAH